MPVGCASIFSNINTELLAPFRSEYEKVEKCSIQEKDLYLSEQLTRSNMKIMSVKNSQDFYALSRMVDQSQMECFWLHFFKMYIP